MGRKHVRFFGIAARNQSGAVAVEFAMIAPVFLLILFATLESGLSFFADMVLEDGVQTVSRLIRTGQTQNTNQAAFRTALCNEISVLLSCDPAKLFIDVRAFSSFAGSGYPAAIDGSKNFQSANLNSYQTGSSSKNNATNTIVLVRAFYKYPLYSPVFSTYYSNVNGNVRLLSASTAFRTEPY